MADEDTTTTEDATDATDTEVTEDETSETDAVETATEDVWTPPTREEWDKLQKAQQDAATKLSKVNAESASRRQKIRDLELKNEDDAARLQREALETAQAKYKPVVAKSALLEANARTDRVGALIKLIDMDILDFAGDDVVGLDAEVERLRSEYPEFFISENPDKPAPVAKPAPKAATAPKKIVKEEPKSVGDIVAARLLGTAS